MENPTQHCKRCNEDHDMTGFYITKNKHVLATGEITYYYSYRCKLFIIKQQKDYREKESDLLKQRRANYYANNKEQISKRAKKYREKNPEKIKELRLAYQEANKVAINLRSHQGNKTFAGKISKLISNYKQHDKKKGYPEKCDLDFDHITTKLTEQENKCYFCKTELLVSGGTQSLNQLSIDRIDNSKGHTKSNTVITCLFCNHAKNINSNKTMHLFLDILVGKTSISQSDYSPKKYFLSDLYGSCRDCDKNKGYSLVDTVTKSDIENLLIKQKNRCAITGIPLINSDIKFFPFKPSVDRIDSSKAHTLDNCQIVCLAVQLGKVNNKNEDMIEYIENIRKNYK